MDELFESCPPTDFAALEEELLGGPLVDDNYLAYRTGTPDSGWPGVDEGTGPVWELYCTACHQPFFRPKRRGYKPSELKQCPKCGANVTANRWQWRKSLKTRLLVWKFQRGEGRRMWLHAYRVTHDFCPEPGDERVEFCEVARYLFEDGGAREWCRGYKGFGREHLVQWRERSRVTGLHWHVNTMQTWAGNYPEHVCEVSPQELRGSCLEYSQLPDAAGTGFSLPEYLEPIPK
ncbi:MAG: hypothetical protein HFH27_11995 [Clostridiaceae bacterium]|nr:hypothetical protein [Clostridiaceae bacterium]MCI9485160.1 hypothetical protein [Clostridiaceae bacterium]